jgi:hypothetical protein
MDNVCNGWIREARVKCKADVLRGINGCGNLPVGE